MTITNNNELVEIRPGYWSKTPQIVDAGDNRRRRDKIRAFTFDFLEQNGAAELIKNKEISRELSFSVWGDITVGGNTSFAHGISATEWKTVRDIKVVIRNDADDLYVTATPDIKILVDSTNFDVARVAADMFDTTDYDTATAYNRGWITFTYKPD